MPIIGVGVDIIHLPRLYALLTRRPPAKFAARIFTKTEKALLEAEFVERKLNTPLVNQTAKSSTFSWDSLPTTEKRLVTYLGGRWAIKEAAFKALYPTYHLHFPDASIVKIQGKPSLILSPDIAQKANVSSSHVSLSHDGEYAFAQVIFERH